MRFARLFAALLFVALLSGASRAAADPAFADGQTWGFEIGLGGGWQPESTPYTRTLETFGFRRDFEPTRFRFSAAVEKILIPHLSILLQTNFLGRQEWSRDSGIGPRDDFSWTSWTLDVHLRGYIPVKNRFRAYLQFGVGPTFSGTRLYVRGISDASGEPRQDRYREVEFGYNVAGLGGVEVIMRKRIGLYVQGGYFYAPSPENRFGDRHQSGGGVLLAGLSGHFGRSR